MEFFGFETRNWKTNLPQLKLLKDLLFFVAKGFVALSIVESGWLRRYNLEMA